jgi:hypothetical protein
LGRCAPKWHSISSTFVSSVLNSSFRIYFQGDSKHLQDIVAQIDTPLLDSSNITSSNRLNFDTPFLRHFHQPHTYFQRHPIKRKGQSRCEMGTAFTKDYRWRSHAGHHIGSVRRLHGPVTRLYLPFPTLERLDIYIWRYWQDDMEKTQWCELLNPFASIEDLLLSYESNQRVAPAPE